MEFFNSLGRLSTLLVKNTNNGGIILIALAFITCCKKTETNNLDAELAKLPPITQTGANTFGCLVNGKAYIPSGYDGQFPNFDVIPDPSDSSIDVRTYNMNFNGQNAYIVFLGGGFILVQKRHFLNDLVVEQLLWEFFI